MPRKAAQTQLMAMLITFVVSLCVVLSFDWDTGAVLPSAPLNIAIGVAVAATLYAGYRYANGRSFRAMTSSRLCPACGKLIPGDSTSCPYCGQDLR